MRYATSLANPGVPFAAIAFICHDRERKNMTRRDKLLDRILRGTADANIPFAELCQLLRRLCYVVWDLRNGSAAATISSPKKVLRKS